ncbi:MAG: glycosyltransferase family 2 protein [Saprospiraceae bacterium]|nr:glycosyltransferase family 2 protein [Saprospiraceae bacterium]
MTDLTVIIPTFNRKESLFRLLDALRSQQQVTLEIIIIDQNSSSHFSEDEHHKLHQVGTSFRKLPMYLLHAIQELRWLCQIMCYL